MRDIPRYIFSWVIIICQSDRYFGVIFQYCSRWSWRFFFFCRNRMQDFSWYIIMTTYPSWSIFRVYLQIGWGLSLTSVFAMWTRMLGAGSMCLTMAWWGWGLVLYVAIFLRFILLLFSCTRHSFKLATINRSIPFASLHETVDDSFLNSVP